VKWISFLLMGVLFGLGGAAWGQSCSVTATPASFGNYDTTAHTPLDTVSEIGVNCESGIPYQIKLDAGQNSTGDFDRSMRSPAGNSNLRYNLYVDSARTVVWGDGTGSSSIRSGTGTGSLSHFNVYGRIFGLQNVEAGHYSDSVIVTVEY
jgi:spore coat protein U-like protein